MKEIQEIHDKILARGIDVDPEERINFSREEIEDIDDLLPDDLHDEISSLQLQINARLPEDFDYFAFIGGDEEPPTFSLHVGNTPVSLPDEKQFDPNISLLSQITELDWAAMRTAAAETDKQMDGLLRLIELTSKGPRATKQVQKDFRDEAKNFIRAKRGDASKIHVLWADEVNLLENEFTQGDDLRAALPGILFKNGELIAIVVGGKPLPADRIDALIREARKSLLPSRKPESFDSDGNSPDDAIKVETISVEDKTDSEPRD